MSEMSEYEKSLRARYESTLKRLDDAKEEARKPPVIVSPEEMYERTEQGLSKSLSPDEFKHPEIELATPSERRSNGPVHKRVSYNNENYSEILRKSPVDDIREVQVRYNPELDSYEYVATRTEMNPKNKYSWITDGPRDPDMPPPVPRKDDIAKLRIGKDGHVGMVNSTIPGAKEGATERLLLEATKDGRVPHSTALLPAGRKMVLKKALDFKTTEKEKYIEKLSRFLSTGKAGKLWQAAPYIGSALSAYTALQAGDVGAAGMDAITAPLGGVESLGVSDEQRELDKKYQEILRQRSSLR